jgi:hypothetical protein
MSSMPSTVASGTRCRICNPGTQQATLEGIEDIEHTRYVFAGNLDTSGFTSDWQWLADVHARPGGQLRPPGGIVGFQQRRSDAGRDFPNTRDAPRLVSSLGFARGRYTSMPALALSARSHWTGFAGLHVRCFEFF